MSNEIDQIPHFFINNSKKHKISKKENKNSHKKANFSENKENESINVLSSIVEEDISSSKQLKKTTIKENKEQQKDNFSDIKPIILSQKAYDKYTEKMKEKTMRKAADEIYSETERLKEKYEEKNSNIHIFDNNPQFQKILKKVKSQILCFLLEGIYLNIFNIIIYFSIKNGKEGMGLSSFCLSIGFLAISLILLISLNIGFLNDPYLSKAFRLFSIFEFLILIISFSFNVSSAVVSFYYIKKNSNIIIKFFIFIIILIMIIFFVIAIKFGYDLFLESLLIFLGKKTEYCILMLKEEQSNKDDNILSTSISNIGLNKTNTDLLGENNIINNNYSKLNNEEENIKNYNYFNKFHYSVSTNRKKIKNKIY